MISRRIPASAWSGLSDNRHWAMMNWAVWPGRRPVSSGRSWGVVLGKRNAGVELSTYPGVSALCVALRARTTLGSAQGQKVSGGQGERSTGHDVIHGPFAGPSCRRPRPRYYSASTLAGEISFNPDSFESRTAEDVLSTLAHEMTTREKSSIPRATSAARSFPAWPPCAHVLGLVVLA